MKQLTMTKVLTPLAALAFAFGVQAATVTDGFEAYTADSAMVTNQYGWTFAYGADGADDASVVTAYSGATGPTSRPEAFANNGDNYLKLSTEDGTLFRNLSDETASRTVGAAGLFVDTDVQFTVTDPTDRPTPTGEDKFIIWLEDQGTSTNLCVWAREFTVANNAGAVNSNKVYTLRRADGTALAITPGLWYRLTVKALPSVGDSYTFPAFQVYLNDNPLKAGGGEFIVDDANVEAFKPLVGDDLVTGQAYFPAMANSMGELSQVGFSGEGAVDNIAISSDIPDFLPRQKVTVSWDTSIISAVKLYHGGEVTTLEAPGVIIVDSVTDITISNNANDITFVGSSNYDFTDPSEWTKSGVTLSLSGDGKVVTCAAGNNNPDGGSFTIGVEANNTRTLTLTADDDANLSSVSYVITSGGVAGETQTISDLGDLVLGGVSINCLVDDVVTFTVVPASGKTATLTPTDCTPSGNNAFTVSGAAPAVAITTASAKATVDGVGYASFADALSAVTGSGTAKKIVLADGATLSAKAQIAADDDITIDLAGNTITGANGNPVFEVAADGALTITNSTGTGYVLAGSGEGAACISNAGTLNLQAGKFNGTISGGTINVTGGAFTANITGANVPSGMKLGETTSADAYVWQLVPLATPTVTVTGGANTTAAWTVNGDTVSAPATLTEGDTYSVTFTANTGYAFSGTPTTTFNGTAGTANISIEAPNAAAITVNVTVTGGANATAAWTVNESSVDAPATLTYGDTYSVTYTANSGYKFADGATTTASGTAGAEDIEITISDAIVDAPVKPTIPENASTVEVTGDGSEDAATIAASVDVAKPAAASDVADETYQGYFKKTATYDSESGKWTVTAEIAETVEQNAATTAAAIVSGAAASGTVTVPKGLYYKVTTMTGLDGTDASSTTGLSSGAVNVSKPGTTQGFIKVQIGTAPFAN